MVSKKLILVFCLLTAISISAVAAPVAIEEVGRKIRGNDSVGKHFSKHVATQVMVEFGVASWYDCPISPENVNNKNFRVNDRIYPVAHKTLPFGTLIKVINPSNKRKILCRVIDRGPYITGRIIDLDRHASHAIGISGVGKVILKIYKVNPNLVALAR